ncbi:hypothetical protein [Chenggangzhangella methanolivorans]|nr:hypothetical protein [Chenggangzhangella methanolivorans]
MDQAEAALLFNDLFDDWIRERLSGQDETGSVIADLIAFDPDDVVETLRSIAETLRDNRDADALKATLGADPCGDFNGAVDAFGAFMDRCGGLEPESVAIAAGLKAMADEWRDLAGRSDFEAAVGVIRASVWPGEVFTQTGLPRLPEEGQVAGGRDVEGGWRAALSGGQRPLRRLSRSAFDPARDGRRLPAVTSGRRGEAARRELPGGQAARRLSTSTTSSTQPATCWPITRRSASRSPSDSR